MIAITFALPAESSELTSRLGDKRTSPNGIISGTLEQIAVGILHTGVGAKTCQLRMPNLFGTVRLDLLISAGFAGSTSGELKPGDLILGANFSDQRLLEKARESLDSENIRVVKLFTAPGIIDSIEERDRIARQHSAAAVDMETEVIAAACASQEVPMLSIRVISDSAMEPLPAPPRLLFNLEKQRTDFARLALHLFRHPGAIGRLTSFSRRIAKAREALTGAILKVVPDL